MSLKHLAIILAVAVVVYFVIAYIVIPAGWLRFEKRHPHADDVFAGVPTITRTHADIPGDPINVGLVGSDMDVKKIMLAAQWHPADPLTLKSCLEIAEATVLKRTYDDAPVSNLYLYGRKEDLAFEQPVGDNPRKRHHVRFWKTPRTDESGRPIWAGSATYDDRVGFSHTTGQITHHIAPDVDAERDHLIQSLEKTGDVVRVVVIPDFHKVREGKNGGGDPWHTDGAAKVAVIKSGS